MRGWLGSESDAFFAAMAKRDVGLRLNPRRGAFGDLKSRLPWATAPVPWCPEGLVVQANSAGADSGSQADTAFSMGTHPYHVAGVYYIQDPSAMAAAVLLDPQPGEWVLDLAAAPGSKATHIAARLQGEGVLVANEISRKRTTILAMNLERMGVTNAVVTNAYPERLAEAWPRLFDAMLVDAPCSGEGMFSRDPQAMRDWSVETVRGNAARQARIMDQAADLVRPGGRILYRTCTFAPEENEGSLPGSLKAILSTSSVAFRRCPVWALGIPNGSVLLMTCAARGASGHIPAPGMGTSTHCCGVGAMPQRICLSAGPVKIFQAESSASTRR